MAEKRTLIPKTRGAEALEIAGLGVAFVGVAIALFVAASRLDVTRVEVKLDRLIEYADGLYQSASLVRAPFEKGIASMTERKWDEAVAFFEQAEASAAGTQRLGLEDYIGMCLIEQTKYNQADSDLAPAARLAATLGDSLGEAATLNNLAVALRALGRYSEAESLLKRALGMHEKIFGPGYPNVATSQRNLAGLYSDQGKYSLAESLLKHVLETHERVFGPDGPPLATDLSNLGRLYQAQDKYGEAESMFARALRIRERDLGPFHPDVATCLNNLAMLYRDQARYAEAVPLAERALGIVEKAFGPDHPNVATFLNNLAGLYKAQGRYVQAETLYTRALKSCVAAFGPAHPRVALVLENMADLYQKMGRANDARTCAERAAEIRETLKEQEKLAS